MSTPRSATLAPSVRSERWSVRGSSRAVLHAGLRGATDWVVLVPGFTGSKEDFGEVLAVLADRGVGAVAFDLFGQHESDGSDEPADYRLPVLAADVAVVARLAQDVAGAVGGGHLLGHSFGGLVASQAVIDGLHPRSLTLLCSGPGALPADRGGGLADLAAALEANSLEQIWQHMPAAQQEMPAEVREFVHRRWVSNTPEHLRQVVHILRSQPDLTPALRRGLDGAPVAIVWGEDDDAWPIAQQRTMAAELGAQAVELVACGHSPNVDDPAALVAALLDAWAD